MIKDTNSQLIKILLEGFQRMEEKQNQMQASIERFEGRSGENKGGNRAAHSDYVVREVIKHLKENESKDDCCERTSLSPKQYNNIAYNKFCNPDDRAQVERIAREEGYVFPSDEVS
jgi:hypothetical protein